MKAFAGLLVLAALAGCQRGAPQPDPKATPAGGLEAAAITAGVIDDPSTVDPTGLYSRDRDRICMVPGATSFRIGLYVDLGDDYWCSGWGEAKRDGETLHVSLASAPGCDFDASFDGERIAVPGRLPDACRKACSSRASLTGLTVERLSDSPSEAAALRDRRGRMLCGA